MIYFDNAATTGKKPASVINAVQKALNDFSANPGRSGHLLSANCADVIYKIREKIAQFFGAEGGEKVVFTMNCTHSINCILKGVLKRGDHIVISSLEHNAVMRPLKKTGVMFDIAQVSFENDNITVENFAKKIKPNTRLILCTGASNVFGKILPIRKIGELCKKHNILFAVDAAQIAGVLPINMQELNIDYLAVAPHKGLYAPTGIGILICRKPIMNTIIEGGTGTNSYEFVQPELLPERLESGTVNVPAIFGIGAGIDYVSNLGLNKIHSYEIGLLQHIYDSLKNNPNILFYTKFPTIEEYAPVLSFNFKDCDSEYASSFLSENGVAVRGGIHCAPMAHKQFETLEKGTVRLSTSVFNTKSQADAFITLINSKKNC